MDARHFKIELAKHNEDNVIALVIYERNRRGQWNQITSVIRDGDSAILTVITPESPCSIRLIGSK